MRHQSRHARFSSHVTGHSIRTVLIGVLAATLAGCTTLVPEYQQPKPPVAAQWPAGAPARDARAAVGIPWIELFVDDKLRRVIRLALDNNRDLRIAALNIERTQAQYRIQAVAGSPQFQLAAAGNTGRVPASVSPSGVGGVSQAFAVDVGISAYELDLFGRLHSLEEQALQLYFASTEARRATHLALISSVARTYMALAADRAQAELVQQTLRSRQKAYDLQRARAKAGEGSPLALRQAQAEIEGARAQALDAETQCATDRNALEQLVGTPLAADLLPASAALASMLSTHDISAGLPSDLLSNRPDILAAEHVLIGANANIGAARAAFFPRISLTATAGRASDQLTDLFSSHGNSWSFVPQLSLPIFDKTRLDAQLRVSEVDRALALARYESVIQTAFREVADALARHSVADAQLSAQQKRVEAAQAAYDLVQRYYKAGIAGHLEVLDAERTLFDARKSLIRAELTRQTNFVALYKALGGGWTESGRQTQ